MKFSLAFSGLHVKTGGEYDIFASVSSSRLSENTRN